MSVFVTVGRTVVGSFANQRDAMKCIRMIAPGCKPQIKKGYHPQQAVAKMRNSNEARQQTNRVVYLRPGEFKL